MLANFWQILRRQMVALQSDFAVKVFYCSLIHFGLNAAGSKIRTLPFRLSVRDNTETPETLLPITQMSRFANKPLEKVKSLFLVDLSV